MSNVGIMQSNGPLQWILHDKRASEMNEPMMSRQIRETRQQHQVEWSIK